MGKRANLLAYFYLPLLCCRIAIHHAIGIEINCLSNNPCRYLPHYRYTLRNTQGIAAFNLTVNPREYEFTTNRGVNLKPTPALAVCTSMPYLSSVPSKRASVNAIFFEWVRYYSSLGIHTVVYGSHGVQKKQLSSSRYVMMQSLKPGGLRRLTHHMDYHNYSILSHLYPTMREWYYDNSEGLNRRLVKFDDDHTYTLTHCRFDVQARLGVRKVLVADFDEFLYCPSAGNTAKEQG